jgi:hypothetical protein
MKNSDAKLVTMGSVYDSGRRLRRRLENLFATNVGKRGGLLNFCANAHSPTRRMMLSYAVMRATQTS